MHGVGESRYEVWERGVVGNPASRGFLYTRIIDSVDQNVKEASLEMLEGH